jgi:glucose-6-phosphate 1-dehydrogenase
VRGYLEEVKVPAGSHCETFVALRTEVQNWRWAGVPFYLRTGKRLAARDAQIVVNFRPGAARHLPGPNARANKLVIKLQPEDGLELHLLAAKGSGRGEALAPVSSTWTSTRPSPTDRVGAYERLLLDAIAGKLNLFVRSDEQEQAWRWVEPILHAWRATGAGPRPYAAGTWGPPPAQVARDGFAWDEEE